MVTFLLGFIAIISLLASATLLTAFSKLSDDVKKKNEQLFSLMDRITTLEVDKDSLNVLNKTLVNENQELNERLVIEVERNRVLLSQKKSSEVRVGMISEHLVPFLNECPFDPKDMVFLGRPIDFISFNLDEGSIHFIEVKTGNSEESKKQKTIKAIVQSGRVYYSQIRLNEKGLKVKKVKNLK